MAEDGKMKSGCTRDSETGVGTKYKKKKRMPKLLLDCHTTDSVTDTSSSINTTRSKKLKVRHDISLHHNSEQDEKINDPECEILEIVSLRRLKKTVTLPGCDETSGSEAIQNRRRKKNKKLLQNSTKESENQTEENINEMKDNETEKNKTKNGSEISESLHRLKKPVTVPDCNEATSNPLHLTWNLTKSNKQSLKEKGVKIKNGAWSENEVEKLRKNVEDYLQANGLTDPCPLIFSIKARNKTPDKVLRAAQSRQRAELNVQFFRTVAKGIKRPLFNVYRRLLRMYDPLNHATRWSDEETDALLRYYSLYREQWTKIGKLLGRSGASATHRFETVKKFIPGYVYWTKEETARLNAAVRAVTKTGFDSQIRSSISWVNVSEYVCSRTANQCREKWLHGVCWQDAQGDQVSKWSTVDDVAFIERLYSMHVVDADDINWGQIANEMPNCPSYEWLRQKWVTLRKNVPNYHEDCDYEVTAVEPQENVVIQNDYARSRVLTSVTPIWIVSITRSLLLYKKGFKRLQPMQIKLCSRSMFLRQRLWRPTRML